MGAFAVAVDAVAPGQPLQGRLRLGSARAGEFAVRKDGYALATADNGRATSLPAATLELVSDGTTLLPLHRGTQVGEHPVWDWVFEPGRVWADPADPDLTHAVMPFALEERNANCLHNGVLTFAIDGRGAVSAVAFEIASETCAYFQFDQWGVLGADFQRVELPAAAAALQARRRELGARLPVRPIEQLAIDHPGAGPTRFGAPEEIDPAAMTAYGVVVDGVHYVGACATRAGPVLDCDELALPSYSLAKSLVAGLAMMRMERLYPGTADQLLSDLVPECDAREWRGVQLRHLLDMSTGHYRSALNQVDEDAADLLPFFNAEGHATRLAFACGHYPRKADPGRRWVYHTSDSYLLGTALARAYRRHAGPAGDFYRDLLVRDVFAPLDLNPALAETRRTRDPQLQPFTGYGLTLHRDDIARLAQFILGSAEAADAGAILDPALLQQALQRDPGRRGFEAPDADFRYQHGFWAWNARHALGCRQDAWIPYLSGYGGIVVALFPNGVIYYYVSDGGVFRWAQAAREANQLRPFCEVNRP
jgi:CubicO group peptidase (beta-lactamase class C family)